jgi:hypothetical protein
VEQYFAAKQHTANSIIRKTTPKEDDDTDFITVKGVKSLPEALSKTRI